MKKMLLIFSVAILFLSGIITSIVLISKNQTPVYSTSVISKRLSENFDTLMAKDLIIIGEALDDVTQENTVINYIDKYNGDRHLYKNFYTTRNIKVYKVIKGEYANNTIQAREFFTGILYGKLATISEYYSPLKKGKLYIFFLPYRNDIYWLSHEFYKFNIDNTDTEEDQRLGKVGLQLKNEILDKYREEIMEVLNN